MLSSVSYAAISGLAPIDEGSFLLYLGGALILIAVFGGFTWGTLHLPRVTTVGRIVAATIGAAALGSATWVIRLGPPKPQDCPNAVVRQGTPPSDNSQPKTLSTSNWTQVLKIPLDAESVSKDEMSFDGAQWTSRPDGDVLAFKAIIMGREWSVEQTVLNGRVQRAKFHYQFPPWGESHLSEGPDHGDNQAGDRSLIQSACSGVDYAAFRHRLVVDFGPEAEKAKVTSAAVPQSERSGKLDVCNDKKYLCVALENRRTSYLEYHPAGEWKVASWAELGSVAIKIHRASDDEQVGTLDSEECYWDLVVSREDGN